MLRLMLLGVSAPLRHQASSLLVASPTLVVASSASCVRVRSYARKRDIASPAASLQQATQLNAEGVALYRSNRFYDAQDRLEMAISIYQRTLSESDAPEKQLLESTWRPRAYLALAQHASGNFEGAIKNYQQSLSNVRTLYGEGNYREARIISNLVDIYSATGKYEEALSHARSALQLAIAGHGADSELAAVAKINLAGVNGCIVAYQPERCNVEQTITESLTLLDEAYLALKRQLGANNPYAEAIIESRIQFLRIQGVPDSEIEQLRTQHAQSCQTPELPPPEKLPTDLAAKLRPKWTQQAQPLKSCDPRGLMLEPEVLQRELREFTAAWTKKQMPFGEELAPVLSATLPYTKQLKPRLLQLEQQQQATQTQQ